MESDVTVETHGRRRSAGDGRGRGAGRHAGRRRRGCPHDRPRPDRQPRRDRAAHPACVPDAGRRGGRRLLRGRPRSLPALLADEAICIGPADAKRSYLSAPALISAALVTGCDAVHPGYGFLSEDDAFADAVRAHGLTFIGPPADVLERFASKEETRRLLAGHGLPTIPGSGLLGDEAHALDGGRAHRLPGARQAVGRRRRQGHADGPLAARAGRRSCRSAAPRRAPRSATTRCTSRSGSRTTATSRSRSRSTGSATASTCGSATARSSAATRRSSRSRRRRR